MFRTATQKSKKQNTKVRNITNRDSFFVVERQWLLHLLTLNLQVIGLVDLGPQIVNLLVFLFEDALVKLENVLGYSTQKNGVFYIIKLNI